MGIKLTISKAATTGAVGDSINTSAQDAFGNPSGDLQAIDNVAQTSLIGTGLLANSGNLVAAAAATANGVAAIGTGTAVSISDIAAANTNGWSLTAIRTVAGDFVEVGGDFAVTASAILNQDLATKGFALIADGIGNDLTLLGLALKSPDYVAEVSAAGWQALVSQAGNDLQMLQSTLSAAGSSATSAFGSLWTTASSDLSNAITSMSGTLTASLGSGFSASNVNGTSSAFSTAANSMANVMDVTDTAAQNLAETNSNNLTTTASGSNILASSQLLTNPDTGSVGEQSTYADGSGNIASSNTVLSYGAGSTPTVAEGSNGLNATFGSSAGTGDVIVNGQTFTEALANAKWSIDQLGDAALVNGSGQTLNNITPTANGGVINDTFNPAQNDQLTGQQIYSSSGLAGTTSTTYSSDPTTTWLYETTGYNAAGNAIAMTIVNRDGTAVLEAIDPTTQNVVMTTNLNAQGQTTSQNIAASEISYPQFVQAVADTLASQLISSVLIKNNLPASIAATAFADASVQSAIAGSTSNFATALANSTFDIAGGIAGSDVGGIVAKALGLPSEVGTLTGGVAGNLVAQELVNQAYEALNLGKAADALTAANFASGLGGAGGAYVGSQLAGLILTPTLAGEVTGAVASAAALAEAADFIKLLASDNPIGAVLTAFSIALGDDFIGNLIGDVFSGLFGGQPSVGPNATALVQYNGSSFYLGQSAADNGGDVTIAQNLASATATAVNGVLADIGGKAASGADFGLGYFKGQFFAADENDGNPNEYEQNQFANASDAVSNAAFRILHETTIVGGNPYMVWMLQHSPATTYAGLVSDLNAASDYSTYVADPFGFDYALAISGNASELTAWQAELARVHALGLDQLTNLQLTSLQAFGSIVNVTPTYISQSAAFMGSSTNFSAPGEQDYFTQLPSGQVVLWRFDQSGNPLSGQLLADVSNASAFILPSGTKVIGTASNLLGASGNDVIVMLPGNGVGIYEFNAQGHLVGGQTLSNPDGSGFTVAAGTQVIGAAHNLLGTGGYDFIVLPPNNGQLTVWEINESNGHIAATQGLSMQNGTPITLGGGSLIGTTFNIFGTGGYDLIIQSGGQLSVWEFNSAGHEVAGLGATNADGSVFALANGTHVLGGAYNYLGQSTYDLIAQAANGQVTIVGFSPSGHPTVSQSLTTAGGAPYTLGAGAQVIGTTHNVFGSGNDLITQAANGQLSVTEFNSSGTEEASSVATVLGTTQNLLGTGGNDKIVQLSNGYLLALEYNSSGALVKEATLTHAYGGALTWEAGSTLLGTGMNLNGTGSANPDLILQQPDGSLIVADFNSNGSGAVVEWNELLNGDGSNYTALPTGLKLLGTGNNALLQGGTDLFLQEPNGTIVALEYDRSSGTVLAGGPAAVLGTAQNLLGTGGSDKILQFSNGNLLALEFNSSGALVKEATLTHSYGGALTFEATMTMLGTGMNLNGTGSTNPDLIFQQPDGTLIVAEFNHSGSGAVTEWNELLNSNGSNDVLPTGLSLVGTGNNALLQGGTDLFLQEPNGTIVALEYNRSTGTVLAGGPTTFMGNAQNLLGTGGTDKIVQLANGNMVALEYNSSGALVKEATLTHAYGGALTFEAGSVVIGTGMNLNATGSTNPAIVLQQPDGTIIVADFNHNGSGAVVEWNELEHSNGSNYVFPAGLTLAGTASNLFGAGGTDLFLEETNGALVPVEYNVSSQQVLAGGTPLTNGDGSTYSLAGATIVGNGQNFLGDGGHDLFVQSASGHVSVVEFSAAGAVLANQAISSQTGAAAGGVTFTNTASALNDTAISGFNGTNDAVDITGHAFGSSTTVSYAPDSANNQSGVLTVSDSGGVIDKIFLENGTSIASFKVASDGNGGILVTDPPAPASNANAHDAAPAHFHLHDDGAFRFDVAQFSQAGNHLTTPSAAQTTPPQNAAVAEVAGDSFRFNFGANATQLPMGSRGDGDLSHDHAVYGHLEMPGQPIGQMWAEAGVDSFAHADVLAPNDPLHPLSNHLITAQHHDLV